MANDDNGENSGKIYIYFGGPSMNNIADLTVVGEVDYEPSQFSPGDKFGYSVASAGDVNGDGATDVIIGAMANDDNGENSGKAYVYGWIDTGSPKLLPEALAIDEYNVEVIYSEEVKDATEASNYSIEPNLGDITLIDRGGNTYRLTTSLAQVKGTLYTITVDNVTDLADNIIDPEHNQATFIGYDPTVPTVDSFVVTDLDSGSSAYTNDATVSVSMTESDVGDSVVKWLINESNIKPSSIDFALTQRPTQYTITRGSGVRTVYAWVMDEYKNVSELTPSSQTTITFDITPPVTPTVIDDGTYTGSLSQLHASWSANDSESGIIEYQYAIGTAPGGTDVVGWKSAGQTTEATETGLSLVSGQSYYFTVMAKNGAGSWSNEGYSDGIIANQSVPEITNISPPDGSIYYQGDAVSIYASASDADGDTLEYQFSINEEVKQSWNTSATYNWTTSSSDAGLHTIKTEVRDGMGGLASRSAEVYIFLKPIGLPEQ